MPLKRKNIKKNVLKNVSTNKNKINIVIDNSKKTVSRKNRTKKSNSNKPPQQINIINQSAPQQARGFDDDLRKFSNDYITPSKKVQKLTIDEPQKIIDKPLIKETPVKESTVKKGRPPGSKNKEKIYASPVNSPMIFEDPNVQSVNLSPFSQFNKELNDVENEFKDILNSNVTDNRKERKKNSKVQSSPMTFTENPSVESTKPRTRSPSISSYTPQLESPDTITNRFSMTPRLIKVSKKDSK